MKSQIIPDLRRREQAAFARLHPRVEAVKASPTAQVAAVASVAGLILAGKPLSAVALGTMWLGSRPLTHVAAASVACVGAVDERTRQIIVRLHQAKAKNRARPASFSTS